MPKYVTREAQNGLWTVVEEGTDDQVAGAEGFTTGLSKRDAEALAARMNEEAAEGKDERG